MTTRISRVLAYAAIVAAAACSSKSSSTSPGGDVDGGGADAAAPCVDTGEHATARAEVMGVVDVKRARIVFYGGDTGVPKQCNPAPVQTGETWTFDLGCAQFSKVDAAGAPGPRARGAAVYDPDGDRMVVFGGRYRAGSSGTYTLYNEVWSLDLPTLAWTKITTTGNAPSARSSLAAVYSPATKEMILFGGNASSDGLAFSPLADVWALDLASGAWRQVTTSGAAPKARLFHAAAIDESSKRMYVYGGGDANAFTGPFFGDLWSLDLASGAWQEESAGGAGAPEGRINAALTFDAKAGRVLLFGGHDDDTLGNNNDTWSFDPASKKWTTIVPAETIKTSPPSVCLFPPDFTTPNMNAPDRRSSHMAVLDGQKRAWWVFGGATDCGLIDDVWAFDLAGNAWSNASKARTGEACVRGPNPQQCTTLCQ
jgi:hypothetical protein